MKVIRILTFAAYEWTRWNQPKEEISELKSDNWIRFWNPSQRVEIKANKLNSSLKFNNNA